MLLIVYGVFMLMSGALTGAFGFSPLPNASPHLVSLHSAASDVSEPLVDSKNANKLVRTLLQDESCYSSESGARAFGDACAEHVIYEDCSEPRAFEGKEAVTKHMLDKVAARKGKGELRLDRITDGTRACGFAWSFTCDDQEGLRGTTFVELDQEGKIQFVREVPEPIMKPGDSMVGILYAIAKDDKRAPVPYEKRTPTIASEIGKYLFQDVKWSDIKECKRFFDDDIFCRDFNYPDSVVGKEEVAKFAEAFAYIPGINFRGQRFDDGVLSTCYVWEVDLQGSPDPIKGISFQEINPETRKISYMRDLSASAVFPPILGKIARWLNPGLGVFRGVKIGSRPGGK